MQAASVKGFKAEVWRHYRREGRHSLMWRRTRDPYHILVSEVMLQQTQVSRVLKFYPRFLGRFPDFNALARARTATVLRAWQGMGYNRRALALRRLAQTVVGEYRGRLPRERTALESLPGVGHATAGAIRAFAWNEAEVFIETNIRRALIHFFFMKRSGRGAAGKVTDGELVRYIKRTLIGEKNPRAWYWALMDYGAALGAAHRASANPNRRSASYKKQSRFSGSARELRGKMIRLLLAGKEDPKRRGRRPRGGGSSERALFSALGVTRNKGMAVVSELVREGFINKKGDTIKIL